MSPVVLVVDDNPVTRKVVRFAFTQEGFDVLEADTGERALATVREKTPDLIFQDLKLPDIDGFELLRRITSEASSPCPPIIAFTGSHHPTAIASGFADLLLKPVEPSRMVEVARAHLAKRRPATTPTGLRVLLVDDDPIRRRLGEVRLVESGFEAVTARDGAEALALMQSLHPGAVVAELLMPNLDGFSLCRKLRKDPKTASIPVVLMTSVDPGRRERELAEAVGASSLASRTGGKDAMIESVRAAIGGHAPSGEPTATTDDVMRGAEDLQRLGAMSSEVDHHARTWSMFERMLRRLGDMTRDSSVTARGLALEALACLLDLSGLPHGALYSTVDGKTFERASQIGFGPGEDALADALLRAPLWATTMASNRPRLLRAEDGHSPASLWSATQLRSIAMMPLNLSEPIGMLLMGSSAVELPARWLETVELLAHPLAQALGLGRLITRVSASEQRFRSIAEATGDGIVVTREDGAIAHSNGIAEGILRQRGASIDDLRRLHSLEPSSGDGEGSVLLWDADPAQPIKVTVRSFEEQPGRKNWVYLLRDLSDLIQLEQFRRLANHDALTGLVNRRRFDEELEVRLAESRRYQTTGALLLMDLDGFKALNDTHGHAAGDAILKAVADILKATTRESDLPARLGGDEFAFLLPHTTEPGALRCARKIIDAVRALQLPFGEHLLRIGTSIGFACFPRHGASPEVLLSAADAALYRAKRGGRNRIELTH